MKVSKLVQLMSAAGMACMISLPVMAQTTTSGDITPVNTKHEHKKHEHDHKKHEHKTKEDKKHEKDKKADATQQGTSTQHQDQGQKQQADKKSSGLPANEQFSSLSEATAHCGSGNVEWATMGGSKVYHGSGSHYFGHTKHGTYACKAALDAAGFRAGA